MPFRSALSRHAKHRKSLFLEPGVSPSIAFSSRKLVMIRAIDLDDQPRFETCKIGDEGADRHLPLEFEAVEPFGAKLAPDQSFNRGLSSPLSFGGGTLAYAYFETCHLCPSAPLPPSLREGTLSHASRGRGKNASRLLDPRVLTPASLIVSHHPLPARGRGCRSSCEAGRGPSGLRRASLVVICSMVFRSALSHPHFVRAPSPALRAGEGRTRRGLCPDHKRLLSRER